jgi:hypothetical protein
MAGVDLLVIKKDTHGQAAGGIEGGVWTLTERFALRQFCKLR